jgi:hypothetical protein
LKHSILTSVQVRTDGAIRDPTTTPPSVIAEATQLLENVHPQIEAELQTYTSSAMTNSVLACRCRRKTRTHSHNKDCPSFRHAKYSRSVATQFMVYSRFVGFCIQAGWQSSRGGGWNTIAPVLRYRAVVSRDSPAFKILQDATTSVYSTISSRPSSTAVSEILATTSLNLQCIFGNEASPTDIDEDGNGIFSVICVSTPCIHISDIA